MKRALLVLLLLAVAGGLFAQVSVGGQITSGILFKSTEEASTISVHHPDGGDMFRARIAVGYTNDDGTAGMNSRFAVRDNGIGADFAWAWFKPLSNFWVNVGGLDQWNYGSMGGVDDNGGFANPKGALLRYEAIPGLNLLGALNINSRNDGGKELADIGFSLGARYVSSLFGAAAYGVYEPVGEDAKGKFNQAIVGFDFLGLSELGLTKLAIDAKVAGLHDLEKAGTFTVGPRIHYSNAGIGIQLRSNVYIPMVDGQDLDFAASLLGQYSIPNTIITVGALGGFELDANGTSSNDDYRHGWDAMGVFGKAIGGSGSSGLLIKPFVSFGFGGFTIETGYAYYGLLDDADATKHLVFFKIDRWF